MHQFYTTVVTHQILLRLAEFLKSCFETNYYGRRTSQDDGRQLTAKDDEGTVNINLYYNFNFNHCNHSHYLGVCL